MASMLTWGELFTYLGILLFVYYGSVLFFFFRQEVSGLLSKRGASSTPAFFPPSPSGAATTAAPVSPDALLYNAVHELMEDCKLVFQAAVSQQLDREPVLEALHIRLAKYPQVRSTAFQVAVTNHIEQEISMRLGWTLQPQELQTLW